MIYGIIPCGGEGLRLGLSFSKEMMPLKKDYYFPVIQHTVKNMLDVGVDKIFFVHGSIYKKDVESFFDNENFLHLIQYEKGFSKVLKTVFDFKKFEKDDKFLFGLPDSVYSGNPFVKLLSFPEVVCGLFNNDFMIDKKVDRFNKDVEMFRVKSVGKEWFWGVFKLDYCDLKAFVSYVDDFSEVGDILNFFKFNIVYCSDDYLDLGTWDSLNYYWKK